MLYLIITESLFERLFSLSMLLSGFGFRDNWEDMTFTIYNKIIFYFILFNLIFGIDE